MTRRFLVRLLHRLDQSPLPMTDPVRLELEAELIRMLAAFDPTVPAIKLDPSHRVNVSSRIEA